MGWQVAHGPELAVGMLRAERSDPTYRDVVLEGRLRQGLARLNPGLPADALDEAYRKLTRADAPTPIERNRAVHRMLVDGVTVEYRRADGSIRVIVKRILRKYGYPPDKQEKATQTVLEQAELISEMWAA